MNKLSSIPTEENREFGPENATTGTEHIDELEINERALRLLPVMAFVHSSPLPLWLPYPTSDIWSATG